MVSRLEVDPLLSPDGIGGVDAARLPDGSRVEIEAKFLIENVKQANALIESFESQVSHPLRRVDIVDSYWDTPDWSLFRLGWAYRWRNASGEKSLTLKSIDGGRDVLHRRMEVEQPGPASPEDLRRFVPGGEIADHLAGLDLTDRKSVV